MVQSGHFDYAENERFQAISLPYGEGRVSMVVILPRPNTSIAKFRNSFTTENWQGWVSRFHQMEGDLVPPASR